MDGITITITVKFDEQDGRKFRVFRALGALRAAMQDEGLELVLAEQTRPGRIVRRYQDSTTKKPQSPDGMLLP